MSLIRRIRDAAAGPAPRARIEPPLSLAASLADAPAGMAGPGVAGAGIAGAGGWLHDSFAAGQSRVKSLPRATPTTAQRHGTVFSCCNVIAGDLAKVTLKLYQRRDDGQEMRVRDHPAAYLLNVESSPGVPAIVARFVLVYAFALRGVSYAYAPRDGAGELELIETLRQDGVSVLRHGRNRFYDFEDGAQLRRRAPGRAMVHMRYLAEDGWTGRSPIEVAAESMGLAMAGQEAAARAASGQMVSAYIRMEDAYESEEDYRRNQRRVRAALADPEGQGFPILGKDDVIQTLDMKASDIELLASRRFDREQIASIWRVPPSKLQILEYGVKANAEQAAIDYLSDCLMHWGKQVEDQLALALLTPREREGGFFLRHDFDTLLRPTTKERYEALSRAVGGPFMTPNEARLINGQAPRPDGDLLNPAPNMTRPADAAGPAKENAE